MTENKFNFLEIRERAEKRTFGRRRRQTKELKAYHVEIDGVTIGVVYERMTTFETKSAGKRYVNSRWESPRWYYEKPAGSPGRMSAWRVRDSYYETRQQAADSLYTDYRLVEAQKEAANV